MKRVLIPAILAAVLGAAGAASAQTIELGPGGVGVDLRNPRQRDADERREYRREQRGYERSNYERRRGDDCRTTTIREEDSYGNVSRKRVTRCN